MTKDISYEPVSSDRDQFDAIPLGRRPRSRRILDHWQVVAPFAWIFTTTLSLVLVAYILKAHFYDKPTKIQCARELSTYSPAWEAVEYDEIHFQNSFFEPSIYRGKPTPERNEAWRVLWDRETGRDTEF
jgi:hypothetical protein